MAEIIARFADGRLLVQEDKDAEDYVRSGGYLPFRIAHVRTVQKVLSVDAHISGSPGDKIAVPLKDVLISGDTLWLQLRRCDLGSPTFTGLFSGLAASGWITSALVGVGVSGLPISGHVTLAGPIGSGTAALGLLSGITSGRGYYETLTSGRPVSGQLQVVANIIGF